MQPGAIQKGENNMRTDTLIAIGAWIVFGYGMYWVYKLLELKFRK